MIDSISWKNNVEHALVSDTLGRVVIPEPLNYEDGNRNIYERDENSKGFLKARSNELEFYGDAVDAIRRQIYTRGIAEDLLLEKIIKSNDRVDELWRSTEPIYLDLKELKFDDKKGGGAIAKTKAVEGGLKKLIDSRFSDEYDLKTLIDADGNTIEPLQTVSILLPSREIFLRSVLSVEDGVEIYAIVSGSDGLNARAIPFVVEINSDQANIDYVLGNNLSAANGNYTNLSSDKIGNCFLTNSDNFKKIIINGKVKVTVVDGSNGTMRMDLIIYENGDSFTYSSARSIPLVANKASNLGATMEYVFNEFEVDVRQGDSLTIGMLSNTSTSSDGMRYRVTETEIIIAEDSIFPASNTNCLSYFQALNRLIYIITGKNNLVDSELLTTGELSADLITNGYYIRNFPDIISEGTEQERKIQFTTSLESLLNHIEALVPKAWWIDKKGNQDRFIIEKYSYTQQNIISIPFGEKDDNGNIIYLEASDIKREVLGKNFYSKIEIGSNKGGDDYEEVNGLRSINGKAYFSTINKNNDSVYSKLSPYRLGDVDIELPRRKPYSLYPEEDTKYDSDIMCIRCRLENGNYVVNKWQQIYETEPTGIYRPNSAFNIDITPARLLLKHSANINSALYHYPTSKLVFASSNCNSSFRSKKPGEDILIEDGTIPHSRLNKPTIRPYTLECNLPVSQELEDVITGSKNGLKNWFGIVALKTGVKIEYFRLIKSDVNKEGKHKFIEANL